jgi:hypothetical protein
VPGIGNHFLIGQVKKLLAQVRPQVLILLMVS